MKLRKRDGIQNAWFVTDASDEQVYGQAIRPTESDTGRRPWFMPGPGRMVLTAEELEAIAVLLRTAPELNAPAEGCGHAVPAGWEHVVLESQPPLPKFWSCLIWRGSKSYHGQSSESASDAVAAAVGSMRGARAPELNA